MDAKSRNNRTNNIPPIRNNTIGATGPNSNELTKATSGFLSNYFLGQTHSSTAINKRYIEDLSNQSSKINTSSKNTPLLNNSDFLLQPNVDHHQAQNAQYNHMRKLSDTDTESDDA